MRSSIAAGRDVDLEGQTSRSDHVEVAAQGEVVRLACRQDAVSDGDAVIAECTVIIDLKVRGRAAWCVAHQQLGYSGCFGGAGRRIDMKFAGNLWNPTYVPARCPSGHISCRSNNPRHGGG